MRRRDLLSVLSGAAAGWPLMARAQARPLVRVGYLHPSSAAVGEIRMAAFREGLGPPWSPGTRPIELILQAADGHSDRLAAMARDLVSLPADAILAASPSAVRAASTATATIPIVAVDLESDPVANGWAASLARPGGNITGVFLDLPEVVPSASSFCEKQSVPSIALGSFGTLPRARSLCGPSRLPPPRLGSGSNSTRYAGLLTWHSLSIACEMPGLAA